MKATDTMKATGIVRRMDDLGRIVIPKEIRKQCGMYEGDPFEIFVGKSPNGKPMVCFAKYVSNYASEIKNLSNVIDNILIDCGKREEAKQVRELLNAARDIVKKCEKE